MLQGPLSNLVLLDIFINDVEESAHWLQNGFLVHHQPVVIFLQSNIAVYHSFWYYLQLASQARGKQISH